MSQFLVEKLITDPEHWEYQVSKVREFRESMRESIAKGKANLKPKRDVVIPPLHNDSPPLHYLSHARILAKRGWL